MERVFLKMKFFNFIIVGAILTFFLVSLGFFVKRYMDNKDKLEKINDKTGSLALQKSLEEELKQKKEEELKKLEAGDRNAINEVIERLFKSSKLGGWVKSKSYQLYNTKTISLIINLSGKEELVNTKKEIVLKSGEVYTQNKHYIAVKKEYSEKVFISGVKIVEELFNTLPLLYKIYISLYLTEEESDKQDCVLSFEVNKDQFRASKNIQNSIEKVDSFSAIYDYDSKNYVFKEIEPVKTPMGEASLEKTMSMKANADTTFFGGSVVNSNSEPVSMKNEYLSDDNSKISSDTKISNLNGSMMLNKTQLGLDQLINDDRNFEDKSEFDLTTDKFLSISGFKVISEESIDNLKIIKALKTPEEKIYLIAVNKENKIIKEDDLKSLFFKSIKDNIEKSVFITESSYALDSVTYAGVNGIELYDKEKINKLIKN